MLSDFFVSSAAPTAESVANPEDRPPASSSALRASPVIPCTTAGPILMEVPVRAFRAVAGGFPGGAVLLLDSTVVPGRGTPCGTEESVHGLSPALGS
jgi:hypothetical protein